MQLVLGSLRARNLHGLRLLRDRRHCLFSVSCEHILDYGHRRVLVSILHILHGTLAVRFNSVHGYNQSGLFTLSRRCPERHGERLDLRMRDCRPPHRADHRRQRCRNRMLRRSRDLVREPRAVSVHRRIFAVRQRQHPNLQHLLCRHLCGRRRCDLLFLCRWFLLGLGRGGVLGVHHSCRKKLRRRLCDDRVLLDCGHWLQRLCAW